MRNTPEESQNYFTDEEELPRTVFVHLKGSKALILERLQKRPDHFMSNFLLDSQFDALEEPNFPERYFVVSVSLKLDAIVQVIIEWVATCDVKD